MPEAFGNPVLYDSQIQSTSTGANFEPGARFLWRGGTQRAETAEVMYVQIGGTARVSRGEVLVTNHATLTGYNVTPAATSDTGTPPRGVAAASIATGAFGFMITGGYCEQLDSSHTAASGEYLMISGSTAAKATVDKASVFNAATYGSSSMFAGIFAVARGAFATGVGSANILGLWG